METQGQAIEKAESGITTQRALITREVLKADTEQRKLLGEYITRHMVKGSDYGEIPGTQKPTLLKPGAEKLVDLFRCTPKFALVKCEEDFERGFFNYMFRCRLTSRDSGAVLAEGFGSANSREGRYRWRNSNRKCPACGKESIIQGKAEYGGGWVCFKKKGGCGAKFKDGDKSVEGQVAGQVENDDIATLANTILKMAKKRALVDGSIALARCSDMFTQDVEDFAEVEEVAVDPKRARSGVMHPPSEPREAAPSPAPVQGSVSAPRQDVEKRAKVAEVAARVERTLGKAPGIVTFGPQKGRHISELSEAELADAIMLAEAKLGESPTATWAGAVEACHRALCAEHDLRIAVPPVKREPGGEG